MVEAVGFRVGDTGRRGQSEGWMDGTMCCKEGVEDGTKKPASLLVDHMQAKNISGSCVPSCTVADVIKINQE